MLVGNIILWARSPCLSSRTPRMKKNLFCSCSGKAKVSSIFQTFQDSNYRMGGVRGDRLRGLLDIMFLILITAVQLLIAGFLKTLK